MDIRREDDRTDVVNSAHSRERMFHGNANVKDHDAAEQKRSSGQSEPFPFIQNTANSLNIDKGQNIDIDMRKNYDENGIKNEDENENENVKKQYPDGRE